jgi:hypothetical protein
MWEAPRAPGGRRPDFVNVPISELIAHVGRRRGLPRQAPHAGRASSGGRRTPRLHRDAEGNAVALTHPLVLSVIVPYDALNSYMDLFGPIPVANSIAPQSPCFGMAPPSS